MSLRMLPTLNAILNATSGILIIIGYVMIRRGKINAHRACMIGAVTASIIFLISYLIYHFNVGATRFAGTGWSRPFYFTVLVSHTILAVVLAPVVVVTLRRALKGDFKRHRKIARWTFPMWIYVSITGVLVYFMLYHWFPSRP
ncbi:MAG TPA: DUF420 domain-containing protein [Blastocatellia bacterium]|nr:DUF420 domain-containing protein [Blastocatellia bacterium]